MQFVRTLLCAMVLCALALVGCKREEGNGGELVKVGAKTKVRIAVVGPLTGPQAKIGEDTANGVRLAVDEAVADGRLGDLSLELLPMDDKADPKEAVSAANKLVADPSILGVVGHVNSGETIPASEVYHRAGLAMITPCATNPKITLQGFENVFRICSTDDVQGQVGAKYAMEQLGHTTFAVIHDRTAYGSGLAEEFKKSMEKSGGQVPYFEGISEGDRDFSAVLTRVKELAPDGLYFGGMYPEGSLIIRQARALGIDATFMTGDGGFDPQFVEIGGPATENAIVTFLAPPWASEPNAKAFLLKYEAKYGPVRSYAPLAYDAANMFIKAICEAKKKDRAGVLAVLRDKEFVYDGVLGPTRFDEKGDVPGRQQYVYIVKDGAFQLAPQS